MMNQNEKSRILVVDDSVEYLQVMEEILKDEYEVLMASSGMEAIDLAVAHSPDMVLLDVSMPGMDGYEVCRRLKSDERTRDMLVVFVTVLEDREDEAKGLALGAIDYITKPLTPAIIKARVRNHINLQRQRAELESAFKEVQTASRAKSEFLASMSHELRTPLNTILGFSQMMKEGFTGDLSEKQVEYVGDIMGSGNHLLSLINDLLDLSKVEAGRVELKVAPVDVEGVISECLSVFREEATANMIDLVFEMPPDLVGMTVPADERRLKQVMFNLLSNAIKFTDGGGTVNVNVEKREGEVLFSVRDTGIGLSPEDQDMIFEEFYQVKTTTEGSPIGTGLGLPLTKNFVELHGGRIWVESEGKGKGKGSTFYFTIPVEVKVESKVQRPKTKGEEQV